MLHGQKEKHINPLLENIDIKPIIVTQDLRVKNMEATKGFDINMFQKPDISKLNGLNIDVKASEDGILSWFTADVSQNKSASMKAKVDNWFSSLSKKLNIDLEKESFQIKNVSIDKNGNKHIKVQQYHNGIKVLGGEIILHTKEEEIYLQNGRYIPSESFIKENDQPISEDRVLENIKSTLSNFDEQWNTLNKLEYTFNADQISKELVYTKINSEYKKAYHIEIYPNLGEHLTYIIDAVTGKTIKEYSTVCRFHNHDNEGFAPSTDNSNKHHDHSQCKHNTALDGLAEADAFDLLNQVRRINTYDVSDNFFLIDASRTMFNQSNSNMPDNPSGVIWTIDMNNASPINNDADYFHVVSQDNTWGESREGVSAHYNAGEAYEYFKNVHGRESISGNGQNIISFVNVANEDGTSMGNAFWNGLGIFYGNGDSDFLPLGRGLDVAGHEISHGVIQATGNMEYFGEPGALNESFADIFGAMIDREDWLIGEDVLRSGSALRSMQDPHNGAATGDIRGGWQPKHYNERYTGSEDNGGVHINSGIPNHAFYLFATNTSKEIAERTYYHALINYMTRSSNFTDCRNAIIQSSQDLYGNNPSVAQAAASAFDQVGITGNGGGGTNLQNLETNPGDDLLLFADPDLSNLFLINITTASVVFNPLTTTDIHSKPSVTDDGSAIVFIGADRRAYVINIDWSVDPPVMQERVLIDQPIWDNIIVSKDGSRIAGTFSLQNPEDNPQNRTIWVYDFATDSEQEFVLFNPTFTEGLSTGNVLYPDAMEFDASGNYVMYDALNRINGSTGGEIEYWDVGFLEVWNQNANTWSLGKIEKLFGSLPEGISVGNPTFSKNSPFIIALDYIEENNNQILGVNIETGDIGEIFENIGLGYPAYSKDDQFLIYDYNVFNPTELGILQLDQTKIGRVPNSDNFFFSNSQPSKWGVWFSNGNRVLTSSEEVQLNESEWRITPNPASDIIHLINGDNSFSGTAEFQIYDISGKLVLSNSLDLRGSISEDIEIRSLQNGLYVFHLKYKDQLWTTTFVKE